MSIFLEKNKKYIHNSTIKSVFDKSCKYFPNNIFLSSAFTGQNKHIRSYTYKEVKKIQLLALKLIVTWKQGFQTQKKIKRKELGNAKKEDKKGKKN